MAKESICTPEMLAAFKARRNPITNLFQKPGKVTRIKGQAKPPKYLSMGSGNHRVTRVRHDIREYLASTRTE